MTISGKYEGKNIYSNLTRIGIKEEDKYLLKCKDWDNFYKIILIPNFAAFFKILTINIWWNQNIIKILLTISGKYKGKYILSNLTRIGIKEKRNIYWNAKIGIKEEEKIYKIIIFPNFAAFFKISSINIWWNQKYNCDIIDNKWQI